MTNFDVPFRRSVFLLRANEVEETLKVELTDGGDVDERIGEEEEEDPTSLLASLDFSRLLRHLWSGQERWQAQMEIVRTRSSAVNVGV